MTSGSTKRNNSGAHCRHASGQTLRAGTSDAGCGCDGPCSQCDGGGSPYYTVEVTSDINICTGCKNTGLSGYASVDLSTSTIPAGTSWCVPNESLDPPGNECVWLKTVSPSPVSGTKYPFTSCSGTPTAMTESFVVTLDRLNVFPLRITFGPFRLFVTTTLPSSANCHTGTFNNLLTSCPSAPTGNNAGYGGTVEVTAGCEEGI